MPSRHACRAEPTGPARLVVSPPDPRPPAAGRAPRPGRALPRAAPRAAPRADGASARPSVPPGARARAHAAAAALPSPRLRAPHTGGRR